MTTQVLDAIRRLERMQSMKLRLEQARKEEREKAAREQAAKEKEMQEYVS